MSDQPVYPSREALHLLLYTQSPIKPLLYDSKYRQNCSSTCANRKLAEFQVPAQNSLAQIITNYKIITNHIAHLQQFYTALDYFITLASVQTLCQITLRLIKLFECRTTLQTYQTPANMLETYVPVDHCKCTSPIDIQPIPLCHDIQLPTQHTSSSTSAASSSPNKCGARNKPASNIQATSKQHPLTPLFYTLQIKVTSHPCKLCHNLQTLHADKPWPQKKGNFCFNSSKFITVLI